MRYATLHTLLGLTFSVFGCERSRDELEPEDVVAAEERAGRDEACQALLDELCRLSSRSCRSARAAFDAAPLSRQVCVQATASLPVLETLEEWQRPIVAYNILALVSGDAEQALPQAYAEVLSSDGPVDPHLPEARGAMAARLVEPVVRVTKSGARVAGDPEIESRLAVLSEAGRQDATERGEEFDSRIQIRADADATAAQLLPALRAARAGGFENLWLVAREQGAFVEMPVDVLQDARTEPQWPVVTVGAQGLRVDDEPVATLSGLSERAGGLGRRVVVRVDPTTSTQTLVGVMEALRGPRCDLEALFDAPGDSPDCHVVVPTLAL